jgi:predicted dehydrogenase
MQESGVRKEIKLCMLGAGRVGKNHSRSITRHIPDAKIIAVVDPAQEIRRETAAEFGIEHEFDSLEQALGKVQFDGVIITTPTPTHQALACLAAENGKHVFLEKPMALNLQECDQIMAAVRKAGVFLQIGFMRRFEPEFANAYQYVVNGEIGNPMMIKSLTHGPGLPPAWARDLRISNGMLAEVNSHDWDTLRWFMSSNYQRVYAEVANLKGEAFQVDTPDFYDNVLVNVKFESGSLGMFSGICPCEYGYDARVEIVGDKGILQIGEMRGQSIVICNNRDQGLITPIYRTWPQRFEWGYIKELEHFINCIREGQEPVVGGVEGKWAVAGVLAATKSFKEERPVYLREVME